jgi:hypothetical protein
MPSVARSSAVRRLAAAVGVLVAVAALLWWQRADRRAAADSLEATGTLQWYRGNIHTHSLWSDGDDYPEMIARWYKDRDYDFLCYTDHNVLPTVERWTDVDKNKGGRVAYQRLKQAFPDGWVEERETDGRLEVRLKRFDEVSERLAEPGRFLLIQGEEISDRFGRLPIHLNVTGIKELIPPMGGESVAETIQNNVDAAISQRERTGEPMIVHLNHPNFGFAVTAEDLMRIRGEKFFEVYNGHPGVNNSGDETHAGTERVWDVVLTKRLGELGLPVMYGLAVDDGHNYHTIPSRQSNPGRGWVMVLADGLNTAALVEAMEAGRFYASSGVSMKSVTSSPSGLRVAVEPEEGVRYAIEFIGTRKGYDPEGKPVTDKDGKEVRATLRYDESIGEVFKSAEGPVAEYRFTGDELYVRARVTSTQDHPNPSEPGEKERAWVQPAIGPAAMPVEE